MEAEGAEKRGASGLFVIFLGFWGGACAGDTNGEACASDGNAAREAVCGQIPKIGNGDFVVCADGGYKICAGAGVRPEAVLGDFDSLSPAEIEALDLSGVPRVVSPREKDDTDAMLCVKYGLARGFERFRIIGGIGGDLAHTLANLQALSFLTDMKCGAEIITETERIFMADGETFSPYREPLPAVPVSFSGVPGEKFSVFSYAERSSGVSIENARYPLSDVVLTQSYPLGVHNEFINEAPVTVSVRHGRLLAVSGRG